ncbi:MAG TPA: PAM68 family protein [Coleofasciculaceae cyanobacterium]
MSAQSQPNSKDAAPGTTEQNLGNAQRQALPFEPKNRKPAAKVVNQPPKKAPVASGIKLEKSGSQKTGTASGIPDAVSRRMVWRMALFCGIPSALGMLTFIGSYLLVSNGTLLPTYAVFLVSLGWFGIGVLGLSYGVLSASWDEEVAGSRLGLTEFATNWGRMRENWRLNAEQAKAAKAELQKTKSGKKS